MTTNKLALRIVGAVFILSGTVLVINPELVSDKAIPNNIFDAIERRIWWGLIIGIGLLLQFHHHIRPWLNSLAAVCTALVVGLLIARLIGIALDGSVMKQWAYVGIEVVILVILLWWYHGLQKQQNVD